MVKDLPLDKILEYFKYQKETGFIFRIKHLKYSNYFKKINTISHGYITVKVEGRIYPVHRIIWIMENGDIPSGYYIDHIDGCRSNNLLSNLRLSLAKENCQNQRKSRVNSKTGILGVSFNKERNKYQASVSINKKYYREFFEDKELAKEWYLKKKREIHPFSTI